MEDAQTSTSQSESQIEGPLNLVILSRLPLLEADLARAKLASEGVECIIRDSAMATIHPLLVSAVPLLVRDTDLVRARQILATPAPPSVDEEDDGYVDEAFRCPKCHKKAVDFLPLSKGRKRLRLAWVALLLLPLSISIAQRTIFDSHLNGSISRIVDAGGLPWAIVTMVVTVVVLLGRRKKHCRECGFEWGKSD